MIVHQVDWYLYQVVIVVLEGALCSIDFWIEAKEFILQWLILDWQILSFDFGWDSWKKYSLCYNNLMKWNLFKFFYQKYYENRIRCTYIS